MPKTVAPESEKERPIRNREVDKQAAALAEKYTLPQVPGKNLRWEQMQEWLALFTPEMWSHVTLYLYRTKPRIIRQLKDPSSKNYIDCISQPFGMEYMIERHGGGRYYIEAVDTNVTKRGAGHENHLFRSHFEIDEVRYPPKIDYEELDINNRENFSYLQMLKNTGVLDAQGKVVANQTAQNNTSAGGINAEVIKEILGFVKSMNSDQISTLRTRLAPDGEDTLTKSVGQILLEKMKQDDPTKQLQTLSQLVTAVKEIVGTSKPADTSNVYGPFIAMLTEQNKALLAMVEKLGNQRPREEERHDGGMGQLDKVFDFADRLLQYRGGNGGRRSGWDIGLDYTRELMPMLNTLLPLALRRGGPAPAPGVPGAAAPPPPPAAFDPYANPAAMRQHADAMRTPAPPPPASSAAPSSAPPPAQAPPATDLATLIQTYAGLVVNALNNGTPGFDFADYVCGLFGNSTHALIASQGEEPLVQTMLRVPELALYGEARLRTFVHEFIHHEEILKAAAAEAETVDA